MVERSRHGASILFAALLSCAALTTLLPTVILADAPPPPTSAAASTQPPANVYPPPNATDVSLSASRLHGKFQCSACGHMIAHSNSYFPFRAGADRAPETNVSYYWQSIPARRYVNPHGYKFNLFTVHTAPGMRSVTPPSTESVWFRGYCWKTAVCSACDAHLGWKFEPTKGGEKITPNMEPPIVQPHESTRKIVWFINPNAFVGSSPQQLTYQFSFYTSGVRLIPSHVNPSLQYVLYLWYAGHGSTQSSGNIILNGQTVGGWSPERLAIQGRTPVPPHTHGNHEPLTPLSDQSDGGWDDAFVILAERFVAPPEWNTLTFQYTAGMSGLTLYRVRLEARSTSTDIQVPMDAPADPVALNKAYYGDEFVAVIADRVTLITDAVYEEPAFQASVSVFVNGTQPTEA